MVGCCLPEHSSGNLGDGIDDRIEAVLFTKQVSGEVADDSLPISIVEHGSTYVPFEDADNE
jgi:hypothetical protein